MRKPHSRAGFSLSLGLAGSVLALTALAVAVPMIARDQSSPRSRRIAPATAPVAATRPPASAAHPAAPATRSVRVEPAEVATIATVPPPPRRQVATPSAVPTVPPRPAKPRVAVAAKPSIDAYRGLGSWVDIFDDRAWADPTAAVWDMAGHGVKTLYIETANSRQPYALKDPAALGTFIRVAHGRGMRVVAWYLPDMTNVAFDYDRIARAIRFRTTEGQKFDSFALDIESGAVASPSVRNTNLETLSRKIRGLVGPSYPLGAIIPSPVGLSKSGSYWGTFPYAMVARTYDVFVPMSYFTYHGDGNKAAYADTLANVRILRSKRGCARTPIHLIGGIAEDSSPSEVRAFVQAAQRTGCIGAGLYGWPGTTGDHWKQLGAVGP